MFSGSRVWVYFVIQNREDPDRFPVNPPARSNRYQIRDLVHVRGEVPSNLAKGWNVIRIESPREMASHVGNSQRTAFRGVTQHLQYTTDEQREELDRHSPSELPPSSNTIAVLIPIGKSREWWKLAQDQRQAFFQKAVNEGHTAIGLRYTDRVYRRLYHSRYLDSSANYDFLTYFEFYDQYADDFRKLLMELRDATRNPEWKYVNFEFEIWLNKVA
jgi:hypothetical protein